MRYWKSFQHNQKGTRAMWSGFDPELRRQLKNIHQMVMLQHQTPTREWPLVFVDEYDALLVVREWPNGSITAYSTSDYSDTIRNNGGLGQ
jgi:hypothetical protein